MPVSGNEEMEVKPGLGLFSEYSEGIPIKKRRFPSQLTEGLLTANEPEQKAFSSPPQDSAVSNDSAAGQLSEGIPMKKRRFHLISSKSQLSGHSPSLPTANEPEQKGFSSLLHGSAISKDSIVATSSKTSVVEAGLNPAGAAGSLKFSGVAGCFNAGSVAASSSASSVALSSTASIVAAGSNGSGGVGTSNVSSVAATISNVTSVAASVSSFSDASGKSVLEKEKKRSDDTNVSMLQADSNLHRVKLEQQSFTIHSSFLADIDSKGKHVATGESDNIMRKVVKPELDLVGKDSLTLNIGKEVYSQQNADGKCRSQVPTVSGDPGLSLGLGECLSAMGSGNNEHGFQNQEKAEPVSLDLSLRKGECTTQLGSTDVKPNNNDANILADRTNWDLNTTMDSWEGSASEDDASQKTSHMDDMKLVCSAGITATGMSTDQKMLEEIESRAKTEMSSVLSSQQYSTEDSLRLGLTTPYLHFNSSGKPSSSSVKVDSCKVAKICSPGESVPVSNLTAVNFKPIKSEPVDESAKTNSSLVKAKPVGSLNITKVKSELVEKCSSESSKSSTVSTLNLVDARSVKPEPVHEGNQETPKGIDGLLNQSDEQMQCPPDTTIVPSPTDLSLHGDVSTHVEHLVQAKEAETSGEGLASSKMISSVGHDVNEFNTPAKLDNSNSPNKCVEDPDHRMKFMDVQLPDLRGAVEGSVSDEEKINLSADILEEDSYGSDYESGDNRELAAATDTEHDGKAADDIEDGEIREPVVNSEIEVPISESQEAGNGNNGDTGYTNSDVAGFVDDRNLSPSSVKEKETLREDPGETNKDNTSECIDTSVKKDSTSEADKEVCLQEPSPVESLDVSEKKDTVKGQEEELTSVQASVTSEGTPVTVAQGADNAKESDSEGKSNSALPKTDGGDRSRIINLSRASNPSSPGRTRSISGRTLLSQVGRERLPDIALEGDEFHPRGRDEAYGDGSHRFSRERHHDHPSRRSISGRTLQSQVGRERLPDIALEGDKFHPRGRDEAYVDGSHRFSRERHHDHPSRNNRIGFMHGRGRISSRIDTLRGDRDSERSFGSEFYNGPTEFRAVRSKYASAVSDADINFSNYNNGQDGAYFGNGRGRRKILSDDSSIYPNFPPRRRSPGARDEPAARGRPMVSRVPRNLSPNRCIGEDGSELVGLRQMRGFADDRTDPMFSRTQPSFEGLDVPFVQTRGLPRIRSKSPARPRTRSPGPWPSFRRRSPDGFGGPLELPGEMVLRRDGSPPYLSRPSNDLRDLDPSRHPRSGIPNRSPSRRILLRNSRQLDLVDPRERNEGDDFFGRPMPSGRFHELGNDGNADERRRYGDRRGPVRQFRPPYSGADSLNFDINADGGPNSFRFCPEDDHERGNMREREFDRRIKNRPGNAPRRTRNIDKQEGNFRHGCQVWHDDGFDDMSRVKRRRF
ncbi:hypothetical protein PTKIN_Ptkin16aG0481000 [Pterospermum kingtungense]